MLQNCIVATSVMRDIAVSGVSVCLSVCLSHARLSQKFQPWRSCGFHHCEKKGWPNNYTRVVPYLWNDNRITTPLCHLFEWQNGVILLIFKMWKFRNIRFVRDYILSTSCEFYYDDVTVTSFINIRYGNVAVEIIQQGTAFCYSFAVGKAKGLSANAIQSEMRPVYGDNSFTRPAINVWLKSLLMVEKVLLMRNDLLICCFDDRCNDCSSWFPHTVWPACDGLNV